MGVDPKLFTYQQINKYFLKHNKIKFIKENLIDQIKKQKINDTSPFFSLNKKIKVYIHIEELIKELNIYHIGISFKTILGSIL